MKNLALAEQAAVYLTELVRVMPVTYFSKSESFRALLQSTSNECEGKRMKLKKSGAAVLDICRTKLSVPLD